MADPETDHAYGTAARDAPVTRVELERALRGLHLSDLELRDTLLKLAARVVALIDEMTRRLDGVEPVPAPPGTPAPPPTTTVEAAVDATTEPTLAAMRASDARNATRVSLDLGGPKYEAESPEIPCAELIPLCQARCCRLSFALSTEDLDEGVIRWDYGQPYLIRQRARDGYCVHNDPAGRGCTVHAFRPRVCRSYDCRKDARVWIDYDQRIPAPLVHGQVDMLTEKRQFTEVDLIARMKARGAAIARETIAINDSFAEIEPRKGPKPTP